MPGARMTEHQLVAMVSLYGFTDCDFSPAAVAKLGLS